MKIKIELTAEEFTALQQLMDAGVKAVGTPAARAAARMLDIFEEAATVARAEQLVAQNAPPAEPATVQ